MFKKRLRLISFAWILYGSSIFFYTYAPFYINFLQSYRHNFLIQKTLFCLLCLYSLYVLILKEDFLLEEERLSITLLGIKKILRFLLSAMQAKLSLTPEERVSLLLFLVKFYFIPIMSIFALNNFMDITNYRNLTPLGFVPGDIFFYYFPLALSLIFFIDTAYFLIGYIIESQTFGNVVLSVENTAFGWLVTLACYPPFSNISTDILGWYPQNFSNFGNIYVDIVMGSIALILMSLYLWATLSLGSKASNLTNRGIVSSGIYKYVRHPAYAAKNLTWWVMGIPFVFSPRILFVPTDSSFFHFFFNDLPRVLVPLLSLFGWSTIYYLRAITEERHLLKDPAYQAYVKKVPYRFIPKLF